MVDPQREHYVTEKKYQLWGGEANEYSYTQPCFLDETGSYGKMRFVHELEKL